MPGKISVAGVARKEKQILVMHRLPGGSVGGLWEFPGGKVDTGEIPRDALRREWIEETGFTVEVGTELARGSFLHNNVHVELIAFEVFLPEGAGVPELREHDDWKWATVEEISEMPLVDSDRIVLKAISD